MKLSNKKGKGNNLSFEVKGASNWQVNTLRRLIISEVPVMAIELVTITKNDSILYDEIIAHRIGLIPLATDLKSYKLATPEELTTGEFLAQSSCKMTLKAKGPGVVFAKDIQTKDPKVKPVYPDMPIVKLLEGQEIQLEATAVLCKGREHVKWSAAHAYYKPLKEGEFLFTMESWGQLKPEEIIKTAVEEHTKELKEFDSTLKSI